MRRKKRRRLLLLLLLVAFIVGASLYSIARSRLFHIVSDMAATQMDSVISTLINVAINEQIEIGTIDYDRMVSFEKNASGEVTALKTNMSEVNHLKTEILNILNAKLELLQAQPIGIPLGNVILPEFFSGRGPELPVEIVSITTSGADFENQFSEAGINQTLHRILMNVEVVVTFLAPGGAKTITVSSRVVVAETVLVGNVPQSYVTIDGLQTQQATQGE